MVFFVCESCNESLKRGKVEAHLQRCWTVGVTCIDCNVTFDRESYKTHTSCISEKEKYEGVTAAPKKRTVQDIWMETVVAAGDNSCAPNTIKQYLPRLLELGTNVPRNQKKFINFVKNSLNIRNDSIATALFAFLSSLHQERIKALDSQQEQSKETTPTKSQSSPEVAPSDKEEEKKKRKKKRKEHDRNPTLEEAEIEEQQPPRKKKKKEKSNSSSKKKAPLQEASPSFTSSTKKKGDKKKKKKKEKNKDND